MKAHCPNRLARGAFAAFCGCVGGAGSAVPDKSGYNLLYPTPREYLRELSTDRPDKTESARTVDAGHFQIEMDLISYTYDHSQSGNSNTRLDAFAIAPINLKVGLLNNLDLQLILETSCF